LTFGGGGSAFGATGVAPRAGGIVALGDGAVAHAAARSEASASNATRVHVATVTEAGDFGKRRTGRR
jgi:hypothetical protein